MKTVCITSGKGGVGKSNIATNLAMLAAQAGQRVLLLDADMSLANVDILLGLSCPFSLHDVIEGARKLDEIIVHADHGLAVLPASSGILKLERLSPHQRQALADQLATLQPDYDLIVFDTGAGLTDNVLFFCEHATQVVLVTTPEPTALTDAYALIKVLFTGRGLERISLIVNNVSKLGDGLSTFRRLDGVSQRFLGRSIEYLGDIPRDPAINKSVSERRPLVLSYPRSPAALALKSLTARLDQGATPLAANDS